MTENQPARQPQPWTAQTTSMVGRTAPMTSGPPRPRERVLASGSPSLAEHVRARQEKQIERMRLRLERST